MGAINGILMGVYAVVKENKDSQKGNNFWGRVCFGWVGKSTSSQHIFKAGLF